MSASEKTFLIIESKKESRELIRDFLKTFGFSDVYESSRLKDAFEILNQFPIDCIVSSWDLPGASGFSLLKLLKAPESSRKTVFILTSESPSFDKNKLILAAVQKVDGFLLKPFTRDTFEKLLREKSLLGPTD